MEEDIRLTEALAWTERTALTSFTCTQKLTQLHIVFDKLLEIPAFEERQMRFRDRVSGIFDTWTTLPDSPIPEYQEHKVQQAATALANLEQFRREASEAFEQVLAERTAEVERQRRRTVSPLLPLEILVHIFMDGLACYYAVDGAWNDDNNIEYMNERRTLAACALVARTWNAAANSLLYLGRVHLCEYLGLLDHKLSSLYLPDTTRSVELFLRSARENTRISSELRYLRVCGLLSGLGYAEAVRELIPLCPNLYRLEGRQDVLHFSQEISLPTFPRLKVLTASDQFFHRLAPLLMRLPALESLSLAWITGIDIRGNHWPNDPPPGGLGNKIETLPPPTFRLKEIRVTECRLNTAQWIWLLRPSTTIEYAQVQQIDESSTELCAVLGPRVRSLHVMGHFAAPQIGSLEFADSIAFFTSLRTLQISGLAWPWGEILQNLHSPLESLHYSYYDKTLTSLRLALPSLRRRTLLQSLVVHYQTNDSTFTGVTAEVVHQDRTVLEETCKELEIRLIWQTEDAETTAA
ncbi:hypothetical protein EIP86_008159 [Pleurotus ostreatoroseus]|nr:hypothetical protein EIP86_008159 [Pleurotus ostreatoroseus]